MAAMLSVGRATHQLDKDPLRESGQSQVFLAINPAALGTSRDQEEIADSIVDLIHHCRPAEEERPVRYPGERTLQLRAENRRLGLPIDDVVWAEIQAM